MCPGSHGVFERDAIEQVQDLRARVVAQDLVRQILNRDGGPAIFLWRQRPTLELRRAGHTAGYAGTL